MPQVVWSERIIYLDKRIKEDEGRKRERGMEDIKKIDGCHQLRASEVP